MILIQKSKTAFLSDHSHCLACQKQQKSEKKGVFSSNTCLLL